MQICVIAKEPRPGFSKTRLTPPCTPSEAAAIAEASLADTLDAVLEVPATRCVLALDGAPGPWLPAGFTVIAQPAGRLGRRLAAAFAWCMATMPDEPVVLIGMDTPQVQPPALAAAGERLAAGVDAVIGPATDGGYWLIGLRAVVPGAFDGVPMSALDTGAAQHARLVHLGCAVETVGVLDDVDTFSDAKRVAALRPGGRFASAVARAQHETAVAALS